MVRTSIENLSNEFFYEMFDYLDVYEVHQAFSNLNYRFHQLLKSPYLLFKINFDTIFDEMNAKRHKKFIISNKHRILSINLSVLTRTERFFSLFSIDSSFHRLESLVLDDVRSTSLLSHLIHLPRLFCLTINSDYNFNDLTDMYRLLFLFPKLKYIKCVLSGVRTPISLPYASEKQMTSIEHFVIDHSCTFNELSILLSYTPQLRRLNFTHSNDSNNPVVLPMKLVNLTSLSFDVPDITFDEFKIFISKLDCQLKLLRFTTRSDDMAYLDANEWETLILKYLPELEYFYFEYIQETEHENGCSIYIEDFNQFNSSFWIDRHWIFETAVDAFEFIYSIRPYKKTWYDIQSAATSKLIRLVLTCSPDDQYLEYPVLTVYNISTETNFFHLEFQREKIDLNILVGTIDGLLELDSLKIHSLSLLPTEHSSMKKTFRYFIKNQNQITKVCLENMIEIEEVFFLIKLCPHMNYLQINCIHNMDVELFMREIINKINYTNHQHRFSLCFGVPTIDDKRIERLKQMIDLKKLLVQYTIKRDFENIYLQWK